MTWMSEKRPNPCRGLGMSTAGCGLAAVALFFLFAAVGVAGAASTTTQPAPAAAPPLSNTAFYQTKFTKAYCTSSSFPGYCVKALTIINNGPNTIYPVLQSSVHQQAAVGTHCSGAAAGDIWLQAAFGDTTNCYPQAFTYHVYINKGQGIASGKSATIDIPFWSQRVTTGGPPSDTDVYIDWWNSARLYLFDDGTAASDGYTLDQRYPLAYAGGSPQVICDAANPGVCSSADAYISCSANCQPGQNSIADVTPAQLNEWTWADVNKTQGLATLNVGYNVSNVDQVYLPVAIEPVELVNPLTTTIGYIGSVLDVPTFKTRLGIFVGLTTDTPPKPTKWPIYAINPAYTNAGIRVPGANVAFVRLASPNGELVFPAGGTCAAPGCNPQPSNGPNWSGAPLVDGMIAQWLDCVGGTGTCPQAGMYQNVDAAFRASWARYSSSCQSIPAWLSPASANSGPYKGNQFPNLYAYLQFVYGWVPFNVACPNVDLPTGLLPEQYIALQNNYERYNAQGPFFGQQLFNPYTQLIHGSPTPSNPNIDPAVPFGLESSAYAYSIDDATSFLSAEGQGLILAVGGKQGLPNPLPYIFPKPFNAATDVNITLGATNGSPTQPKWVKYSLCGKQNEAPSQVFAPNGPADGSQRVWVQTNDPLLFQTPCYVKFQDNANPPRVYQLVLLKPVAQWAPFTPSNPPPQYDTSVMSCPDPTVPNYKNVPGSQWCGYTQEVSQPGTPAFNLSVRSTLPASNN